MLQMRGDQATEGGINENSKITLLTKNDGVQNQNL